MDGEERDEGSAPALLLPFYVNGTLSADEHERIEDALAVDPGLRAELKVVREIRALIRAGGAALDRAAPERLEALMSRIGEQRSQTSNP